MHYSEQRKHERAVVDIYVHWGWTPECPYTDRIVNLGAGGCFVRTTEVAERGRPVFLRLWLDRERTLRGWVRYRLERVGLGVEFQGLTSEESSLLEALVEHYRRLPQQ